MIILLIVLAFLAGPGFAQHTEVTQEDTQTISGTKTFTGATTISAAATITSGIVNGVYNAGACSGSPAPSWCSGSDIGAWVNAAVAALPAHCGTVYIPNGSYNFSTTIVKTRCLRLNGAGANNTQLTYTSTSGVAVIVADSLGSTNYPNGEIADLNLIGQGSGTASIGIYYGGSTRTGNAPSTGIDPASNYGDHDHLSRVHLQGFGVGIQIGNNTWANVISESTLTNNGVGWYFPSTAVSNSGESMSILGTDIINSSGIGIKIDSLATTGFLDLAIHGGKIDYNGSWAIQNGTSTSIQSVSIYGTHIEQPAQWIQNYGKLSIGGSKLTNGLKSGTIGYLIDNESSGCSMIGGEADNSGSGSIFNSGGQACSLFGLFWSGRGLGIPSGYAANPAFYTPRGLMGSTFSENGTFVPTAQGMTLNWNFTGSQGEGDVTNNHGGGTGGWNFYDCSGPCLSGARTLELAIAPNGSIRSAGTAATLNGTGACASRSSQLGGAFAGQVTCTGTTGASTLTIRPGNTAANGWSCWASDITHTLAGSQSTASATAPVMSFTSVSANDVITFGCLGY